MNNGRPKGKSQNQKKIDVQNITCLACGNVKKPSDFYISHSVFNVGTGRVQYCKECCIKNSCDVDGNININALKQTLEKIDKPFLKDVLQSSFEESKNNINKNGTETHPLVLYFKNIGSLPQYKNLYWKDSNFEPQLDENINNTQSNNFNYITSQNQNKIYSHLWMGEYTQSDIDFLDNYLKGLHNDFKIITENHKDYAKKIAKASLHMDKCFQEMLQGISGADKRYKDARETFDTLSKSAQFSENTRGINDVSLGGYGVTFEKIEQKTWIPKHTPLEKDDFDKLIDYFSSIKKSM